MTSDIASKWIQTILALSDITFTVISYNKMSGRVITSFYFQVHGFPGAGLQGPSKEKQKLANARGPRAEEEPEVEQGQGEGEEGAE